MAGWPTREGLGGRQICTPLNQTAFRFGGPQRGKPAVRAWWRRQRGSGSKDEVAPSRRSARPHGCGFMGKRLPIWLIRAPQASPIRRAAADQVVRRASHNLSAALLKSGNSDRRGALLLGTNSNDFREQHREIRLVTVDYNRLVLVLSP